MYYRGAHGVLIIYDLTDISTIDSAKKWIIQLNKNLNSSVPIVIAGNKCDLVNQSQSNDFKEHYTHFTVSAKNININELFRCLIEKIKDKQITYVEPKIIKLSKVKSKNKFTCC